MKFFDLVVHWILYKINLFVKATKLVQWNTELTLDNKEMYAVTKDSSILMDLLLTLCKTKQITFKNSLIRKLIN